MRKYLTIALFLTTSFLLAPVAQAEYFGMVNGRGGDLRSMSDLSIEAGFVTGDFGPSSYDLLGMRVNYRIIPGLLIYGDLGRSDVSSFYDGNALGFGMYYQLQNLIPGLHSSIRGGIHRAELSGVVSGFEFRQDLEVISAEFLISGQKPITESGLGWYANAGISRLDNLRSRGSDVEPSLGGGMFLPVGGLGEVFFGADYINEITIGGGFRFSIL